jgi:hypothetical protein
MTVFSGKRSKRTKKTKARKIKKPKGRWGRKFRDKRDWRAYNEELVVRGEFLLECGWVESWDDELAAMNEGKRGKPFAFPESLIRLQGVWHQWVDYRGVEGVTRKMAEANVLPQHNDFSTINRRVNALEIGFELPKSGSVRVASDGTGMKLENGGEHRAKLYGKKKRRYVKVVIVADPLKKELLDCSVSIEGEGPSEPELAKSSMESMLERGLSIIQFWGDGSFDDINLFGFLEANGIEPAVKTRKNAVPSGEDTLRDGEIEDMKKKGYRKWARKRRYGMRWPGTEGIFSAVKRKYGECLRAHLVENALKEAKMKFWAYEAMRKYARA